MFEPSVRSGRLAVLFLVCAAPALFSKGGEAFKNEDIFQRYLNFGSLVKGGIITPHWLADGNCFWYAEGAPAETIIYKVDPVANTKDPLFDIPRLRKALAPLLGHEPPYKGLPFETFAFVGEKAVQFSVENKVFNCSLDTYTITPGTSPDPIEAAMFVPRTFVREGFLVGKQMPGTDVLSPDMRWFATIKDYNLWLRSTYDGREEPVTTCGAQGFEWDVEGTKWKPWSPSGLKIAVFKTDYRKVFRTPAVHWLKPNEELEWLFNIKAGGPLPRTELYIIDILSKKQTRVDLGDETDFYFNIIGWLPDGSELIIARFDRPFKKVEVMAVNPSTGAVRVILQESQPTFIRIHHMVVYANDVGCTMLGDSRRFIWMSERDGWNHLYLYDLKGNLIRRLTQGAFPVLNVVAVDEGEGWVYFTAHAEPRLYDTHLYRVGLDGKGFARLTEAPGQHYGTGLLAALLGTAGGIQFSPSKKFLVDTHSSVDRPPSTELRKADGTLLQTLAKADIDELTAMGWAPPEEFEAKAADRKTDLYGVIYKPFDFNPGKKYPVVEYIYGGPQTTNVPRDFGHNAYSSMQAFPRALAQLGYIVLILDARGTPERSKAFQDVVYENWGRNEIPDHAEAIRQLAKERPYLDVDRVGIFGHSWGGYFTVRAMTQAPELYKVGVCSAPGFEPIMSVLYEPYLGLPQDNKAAYEFGSSNRMVKELRGKLLLINGTSDWFTFPEMIRFIEALVREGKPYDLVLLPEQGHGFLGKSERYWVESVKKYFLVHLPPTSN